MKSIFTVIAFSLFLFSAISLHAQITTSSQWTWMKGDSTIRTPGVYGVQGVAAAANNPGARDNSASWTDADGNFWLFGGSGLSSSDDGFLNDFWKYNPATNLWTWVKGANTTGQQAVSGTMGVPSADNIPGARYSSTTWTDAAGNLWLFGGRGYSSGFSWGWLNDLWKYDPATNQWTWVKGANFPDQHGVYGIMGTPSSANMPGARDGSVSWRDAAGNLWLFGGFGYSADASFGYLNDLWKYSPATNQWTWVKGSNILDQPGVYGTMGMPSTDNVPGARGISSSWIDATGNLWLFGGRSWNGVLFNDLWKYIPATNQWTWINGANTTNESGVYGIKGTPSATNVPGARYGSVTWTDAMGNLWLFGGITFASYNDLWKYTPATNQWTWVKGVNFPEQPGVYGTKGTPSVVSMPGAKGGSSSWADAAGNFWLFGGIHYNDPANSQGMSNDLWKLSSSSVLPVTLSGVKAYQQSLGITIEWKVENESGIKQYDIEKSSNGITFTKISVQPAKGNNLSTVNYSCSDLSPVTGSNFYRIRSLGVDGEVKYSPVMRVSIGNIKPAYEVYPNPATNNTIQLQFISQAKGMYHIRLLNTFGQVMLTEKIAHETGSSTETIKAANHLAKGQYILEVTAPDKSRQSIKVVF